MACGCSTLSLIRARDRFDFACAGVPPEKEVTPEPRENGATIAALGRVLRHLLVARR